MRRKLRSLESKTNQTTSDITTNQTQTSKNAQPTQRETGQNIEDMNEMKNFLAGVMSAISAFDNKLTNQIGLSKIHSDRS